MIRVVLASMVFMLISVVGMECEARNAIVADSSTRKGLPGASVFDAKGKFIGVCGKNGELPYISRSECPITVRYMGFYERRLDVVPNDTIFLRGNVMDLPEVVVESRKQKALHILAYVREYSTLSTYTDTVTLFREKMVDFMLPTDSKSRFKGWYKPRIIKSQSYYRFTNANGLDSVSSECNNHFSWSDWVGVLPTVVLPKNLVDSSVATDTLYGKYSPTEIWQKNENRLTVNIDVLADTTSRRWVPNFSRFFNREIDFEQFRLCLNYDNVSGGIISPLDLTGYSFNIDSRGRGRDMFMFNKKDEPFFVSSYAEVYVLDKEYITISEAKKWEKGDYKNDDIVILEPVEAPPLQPEIQMLIARVKNIDVDKIRLDVEPDQRLVSPYAGRANFSIGHRALSLLKDLIGISYFKSHKNFDNRWKEFRRERQRKNRKSAD